MDYKTLIAQAQTIRDAAKAQGRELTADELASIQSKLDQADAMQAEAEVMARLDKASVPAPKSATRTAVRQTESIKEGYEVDPKAGFANQTDFLKAVHKAERFGYATAPDNLKHLMAVGGDGHHGYDNAAGGFLVPKGFLPTLLEVGGEVDPMAGRTRSIPMASPTLDIPARVDKNHANSVTGGFRTYRRREEAAYTSSQGTFELVSLKAENLTGLAYATEEILSDSAVSVAALIQSAFANGEFTNKLIDERLNGTGVGEFEGVHNSAALVTVAKESGQTADTIVFENVIKMRSRCWGYNNAVWLANHDTLPTLAAINDGTNHIWMPSAREGEPDMLLGRPIYFTEYMETVGDLHDIGLYNFNEYLEGTYQPLQNAESVHVRFSTHERAFKFWMRNDGKSWWRSALTPKNSSNTLSPFVALAARA